VEDIVEAPQRRTGGPKRRRARFPLERIEEVLVALVSTLELGVGVHPEKRGEPKEDRKFSSSGIGDKDHRRWGDTMRTDEDDREGQRKEGDRRIRRGDSTTRTRRWLYRGGLANRMGSVLGI